MELIFTRSSLRYLFYILLLLFVYSANAWDLYSSAGNYLFFTIALFLYAHVDISATTALQRFVSVAIVAILSAISIKICGNLALSFAGYNHLLPIYVLVVVLLCTYLGYKHYFSAAFAISIITIMSAMVPVTPTFVGDNITAVIMAWISFLVVQLFTMLGYGKFQYRQTSNKCFYHLRELNKEIFACFLTSDYQQQLYLHEHRIHEQKRRIFTYLQRLKQMTLPLAIKESKSIEKILDLTFDYSQLRHRVKDASTFELCAKELTGIMAAIDNIYTKLLKNSKKQDGLVIFAAKLEQFEANYQQVLQVAARDPLDFMLFLQSLKLLHNELSHIILDN